MLATIWKTLGANFGTIVLFTLLAASLAINVIQATHLRSAHASAAPQLRTDGLKVGSKLPTIPVRLLDGSTSELLLAGDRATVLYVLSPFCGWCKRNHDNVVAIANSGQPKYRFIGLAIDGTEPELRKYLDAHPMPFPVVMLNDPKLVVPLGLGATPTTALIDEAGVVAESWVGAYGGHQASILEERFSATLPGISAPAPRRPNVP